MEIYSKKDPTLLLHKIFYSHEIASLNNQRKDLSNNKDFLQLSILNFNSGKKFDAHYHLEREKQFKNYWAQECWVVLKGRVLVSYYDIDNLKIKEMVISKGDVSITFKGGHAYEILEDSTVVYELKTGPYEGKDIDKKQIN